MRPLAVITGATAGIGASFARKLARRGYDLLLVARRADRLRLLTQQHATDYGIKAEGLTTDLTNDIELGVLAERVRTAPNLALLVNNAGFGTNHYFFETDPAGQDQMNKLHMVASARLTHAALANLVPCAEAGTGVINVSSVAAFMAAPQNVSYNASKTWMNRFTEGLAVELEALRSPVTVQALCPGYTLTEFHDVMQMDRAALPSSLWMPADAVVDASLDGFARRKLIVIPGWRYRLLLGFVRSLPAAWVRWGSIRAVQRYRKRKHGT